MELWQREMRRDEGLAVGEALLNDRLGTSNGMIRAKTEAWDKTKQWFTPERICWGWNVMEEEGVVVSKDILKLASGDDEGRTGWDDSLEHTTTSKEVGGVEFLLYCKQ